MDIHIHPCPKPNVGDVLNTWFWPRLLGSDVLDLCPGDLLVGVGTVLNDHLPKSNHYHVLGAGAGYGSGQLPCMDSWNIYFVRGKLTARFLGLDQKMAISDPAILIDTLIPCLKQETIPVSFMPHTGIDSQAYRQFIEEVMEWHYISPSDPEHIILDSIASSQRLITSAMHGAIIADAYRTPWLGIKTSDEILSFKWHDWWSSLGLKTNLVKVPAYWPERGSGVRGWLGRTSKQWLLQRQLRQIKQKGQFVLSKEVILRSRQHQVLEAIGLAKQDLQCREVYRC